MRCITLRKLLVLAGSALWLAGLGWIDRATGYELGLFAFYTAPVAMVAWNLGQGPGIVVAFIASLIWWLADRYAGDRYSVPFYGYWNTGMHFTTFIINAVTFAKIKSSLDQRHALERALAESQEQVNILAGQLLRQRECDKPHALQADPDNPEAHRTLCSVGGHPGRTSRRLPRTRNPCGTRAAPLRGYVVRRCRPCECSSQ